MSRILGGILYLTGISLYVLRLHRLVIWWNRRNAKVLLYHACDVVESDFTRGLKCSLTPRDFGRQLDYLKRHYNVVPVDALDQGQLPDKAVAITFDDGYRSVYLHAYPELRSRQMPATVYLITDVVDNEKLAWFNELNWLLHAHRERTADLATKRVGLPPSAKPKHVVAALQLQYDHTFILDLLDELRVCAGLGLDAACRDHSLYLSWNEIREMRNNGFTFGNHSKSHPNLAGMNANEQRAEIEEAHEILLHRIGGVDSLSYPFGYYDETSLALARELGIRTVMQVGGTNVPLDPHALARVPVRAATVAGLFAQMEVVEPIKAWFRKWHGKPPQAPQDRVDFARSVTVESRLVPPAR